MLLSAPPLEHTPPRNVSREMYTGRPRYSLSARMAAPPRSGPVESQRLLKNFELTTLSWPPRAKIAPPPPPSKCCPVELPFSRIMFWTISTGLAWSWQCDEVHTCAGSQVSMYRIRRTPPPLSVTFPPPSITTWALVLRTFAVALIMIVTGRGPQEKVITPPAATAATTALDVQLAAVPLPMTRLGCELSTGRAAAGTSAWPSGLPAAVSRGTRAGAGRPPGLRCLTGRGAWLEAAFDPGRVAAPGVWLAGGVGSLTGLTPEDATPDEEAARAAPGGCAAVPQAAMPRPAASAIVSPPRPLIIRTRPHASPAASDQVVIFHQMTDRRAR